MSTSLVTYDLMNSAKEDKSWSLFVADSLFSYYWNQLLVRLKIKADFYYLLLIFTYLLLKSATGEKVVLADFFQVADSLLSYYWNQLLVRLKIKADFYYLLLIFTYLLLKSATGEKVVLATI